MKKSSDGKSENDEAQTTVSDREKIAALTSDINASLVKSKILREMLQQCCDALVKNLGAAFSRIWTLNAETNTLELQASAGMYSHLDGEHSRIPVGRFKIGKIAQDRQPHLTNKVIGDEQVSNQDWAEKEGMVAFAGYPLIVEDRLIGVAALFAREPLSESVINALATVADGIALGIERHQTILKLQEQTEVVETINRIGQLLSAELDLQNLVQAVTDAATELTGAQFGSFFYNVLNEEGASYMLYTLSGVPREAFSNFPMPRATKLFGPTFQGEKTIRIADVHNDRRYGKNPPYNGMPEGHLPVRSYLAVPVIAHSNEVVGGLFFGHSKAGVFTERHEQIVEGLASQAAIAVDNARLYEKAKESIKEREELLAREQKARHEAEIASRMKDEFLGLLSHELRTPLNAIVGWTRMLNTGELDEATFARAVETIDRNAKLQARLIDDMLDVSRIISGKLRLDAQPVDLTAVINSAVDTLRPAADAKEIRIYVVLDFGAGMVLGDPVRLQQIVWNLLSNAIKFTPKQGSVQVSLQRVNSHVEVTVSDTGIGIDEAFLPYVFDRFRQADSTSSKQYGGLGLGLAIVRHLVEMHGGTVEAANRNERQGAVFSFKLPVMVVRQQNISEAGKDSRVHPAFSEGSPFECPPELNGIKILAVDDEPDARELLTTILEQCGAHVKTCGSVKDALTALKDFQPDVLISDIGMPGEDGYSLIRKIRVMEEGGARRLPAVALTAFARVEDRLKAFSAGYNMHVPKPVEPIELALVVASLTAQSKKT